MAFYSSKSRLTVWFIRYLSLYPNHLLYENYQILRSKGYFLNSQNLIPFWAKQILQTAAVTATTSTTKSDIVSWTCFLVSSEASHACVLNTVPSLHFSKCAQMCFADHKSHYTVCVWGWRGGGGNKVLCGKINKRTTANHCCQTLWIPFTINFTLQLLYLFGHEPPCYGFDTAWPPRDACIGGLVSSQLCSAEGIALSNVFMYWWAHSWMGYWQIESLWRKWVTGCTFRSVYLVPRVIFCLLSFWLPWN